MARTALAYFETILEDDWSEDVIGRQERVPYPGDDAIVIAGDADESRVSQAYNDCVFIRDGGPQSLEPRSVGWTERRVETMVTIDVRTSVDRARLEGVRDDDNKAESYGGLRGEIQRILDTHRKGDKEFDWIDGYEWNDLSEDVGYGFWRGTWEIRLTRIASEINP